MEHSQEYLKREFMHNLSDTLALLGADEGLVRKIQAIEERPFTSEIIEELRSFNYDQLNAVRTRLTLCYKITIKPE